MPRAKRFRVALSFPGERRCFVEAVARRLAERVGKDCVFYDNDYRHELARFNLDTYLQAIYRDESDLIAVFLDADYKQKEWCGLEWRVVRELIKQRQDASVMPFRFDDTHIDGLLSIDGYVDLADKTPDAVAELIVQRLESNQRASDHRATSAFSGTTSQPRRSPTRLTHGAATLFGREADLDWLDAAWDDPKTYVVTLVAWGGVGKTSLVAKWVAQLAGDDQGRFDGADYFDWSFYSQGVRDVGGASADVFVNKALEFFGDPDLAASNANPHDKGARLAQLVGQRRTLLVLDGLEPLQDLPSNQLGGKLKDPAVAALLKGLALTNPGLCIVTTRVPVENLVSFRDDTAPERRLSKLSTDAGVLLLESLGVKGPSDELEQLVDDVDGHALTLNLLGRFLARAHGGDVRRRDRIDLSKADSKTQGGHAFKAMGAYEAWLAEGGDDGVRQLAVLRLLGLFDRPANRGCLEALRQEPALAGLTEPLVALDEEDWNLVLSDLADHGLVTQIDDDSGEFVALDAHPLVREYFAGQLKTDAVETWQAAHGRLYEHLCEVTEHQPDTLEGLQPLYQAVAHGCWAGREQEACDETYFGRIARGQEFYSTKQLGAFGADLGAVACFFDQPWSVVSKRLTDADQAWLLNQAAFRLRGVGRLREALEPMRAGLRMFVAKESWKQAASGASNLSELELTLGEVDDAVRDATHAVDFADRSRDWFHRMSKRTALADSLAQAGQATEALEHFREAEALQAENQSSYPLLYSLQGFQYCDLLLAKVERRAWKCLLGAGLTGASEARPVENGVDGLLEACDEVEKWAAQTLEWALQNKAALPDVALNRLTRGRIGFYRPLLARANSPGVVTLSDLEGPRSEIEKAVDGLRRAGQLQLMPLGLLTRAWLRVLEADSDATHADLDGAWEIAAAGPMPLFQADIQLYRARLFRDREALVEARRLITKHGYGRRLGELEDAEEALAP